MKQTQTYECIAVDNTGVCTTWQVVQPDDDLPLTKSEQNQLTLAILSVMVLVWLFKQLKRAL